MLSTALTIPDSLVSQIIFMLSVSTNTHLNEDILEFWTQFDVLHIHQQPAGHPTLPAAAPLAWSWLDCVLSAIAPKVLVMY